MKLGKRVERLLIAIGCGLLLLGLGLGLLFGSVEVPVSGPAGIVVATLFGFGLCILLLAALHRLIPDSNHFNADIPSESDRYLSLADLKVWRTKLAICFSATCTVLAFALFFGGILVAFIGFDFASGTNDIGLIMILTGMVVGAIAIFSGFVSILLGWSAWYTSRKVTWLFVALAVPIFQVVAYLFGNYVAN